MKKLILVLAIAMLGACDSDDDDGSGGVTDGTVTDGTVTDGTVTDGTEVTDVTDTALLQGIQSGATVGNVPETIAALEGALNAIGPISIVAQIDHQANASNVDLELRPTSVTLFGNPILGTPLMQLNQLAGLDLPQKMFAWEDESGQSNIGYNSATYLSGRHGLGGAQTELDAIDGALAMIASTAAGQEFVPSDVTAPAEGEGIIIVPSANDMDTTYNNLRDAINAPPLTIFAELDHSQNAANVQLALAPTRLIVFGNPNLGTPLMQSGQSIGIDLPQKMLVYENADGEVSIAYNDPAYLAQRHGITDQQENINTITGALDGLATGAATAP